MRIVSLGRLAGIGTGDDHPYEGSAYLLRFKISSTEQFFEMQLPFIVKTLRIDPRQIMGLELLGDGYSGLKHGTVCISFEDAPKDAKSEPPERLIEKLCDAPSTPVSLDFSYDEIVRERFVEFLTCARNAVKRPLLETLLKAKDTKSVAADWAPHRNAMAGLLYRLSYDAGSPPDIEEWRNALLYCYESFRRHFRPERIERIRFIPIPNSDANYKVEIELRLSKTVRLFEDRSTLRFRRPPTHARSFQVVPQTGRPEHTLSREEKRALSKFDQLDTNERLRLWNYHLSKFFK